MSDNKNVNANKPSEKTSVEKEKELLAKAVVLVEEAIRNTEPQYKISLSVYPSNTPRPQLNIEVLGGDYVALSNLAEQIDALIQKHQKAMIEKQKVYPTAITKQYPY